MNKRLEALAAWIENGTGLIDVGTDHAYLPIAMAQRGYQGNIFASDIGEGPLCAARRNAADTGLTERIHFLLSDGLDACPEAEVDTIVIAGMGGDTICGILDRAEWCMDRRYTLLLQPMTKAEVLRFWLCNNGFMLEKEALIRDAGTVYQLIKAVFTGRNERLSDAELFTGFRDNLKEDALLSFFLEEQERRFAAALEGLQRSGHAPEGRLALYGGILSEIQAWRNEL